MRVLVVDDSRTMRKIIVSILKRLRLAEVEEASNGQEALERVESFKPELLLIDWWMPVMDGMQFLRAFRRRGYDTPVMMITTEAKRRSVLEAARIGVDDYVVKPFTPDALLERIRGTLQRNDLQVEPA